MRHIQVKTFNVSLYSALVLALLVAVQGSLRAADETPTPPQQGPSLLSIDVSGKDGVNGSNGASHNTQASMNTHGRNGGDATPSTPGEDAGQVQLHLIGQPQAGAFILRGNIAAPGGKATPVEKTIQIGSQGYLYLSARGGNGGNGGHGGRGQDGGDGSDGTDATRFSWGTDGRPGGNGGNGGNASSGSPAGHGGEIIVTLNEKDTYLLMLPITDVKGGSGGKAGRNGTGGRGGEGGEGGSHYYESEQVQTGTDSQGNPTYETRVHSNPGGSDGPDGSQGRDGYANVTDGADGKDGSVRYVVESKDGKTSYTSRYDIRLLSYGMESADANGINEPGETIRVSSLRIKNTGGMPSPAFQKVKIFLGNNEWVIADGQVITVPRSLAPGEEFDLPGEFQFQVRDNHIIGRGDRFLSEGKIEPLASLELAERPFTDFTLQKPFQITFPIEITPITALRSLQPGESTRLFWSVKNVSGRPFGSLSEIKRLIQVELTQSGEGRSPKDSDRLSYSDVQFVGPDGKEVSLQDGFLQSIANLRPGESVIIEGTLAVSKNAPFYRRAALNLDLSLGDIAQPNKPITRQIRTFDVRVSQTYRNTRSQVLLVVNSSTTPAEIKAWKDALARLKLNADIWDLSLYGYLEFTRALDAGSSLAQDFRGKTAIILNNVFSSTTKTGTTEQNAAGLLSQRDLLKAAGSAGMNLLFIQDPESVEKEILGDYLFPKRTRESGSEPNTQHTSLGKLIEKALSENSLPAEFTDRFEEVEVSTRLLWGKPKSSRLESVAARVQDKLNRAHPDRRYEVIYHHDPQQKSKNGLLGLFKKWSLGRIEVRRTLDRSDGSIIAVEMSTQVDPQSQDALSVILLSLSPERRVELLSHLTTHPSDDGLPVLELLTRQFLQEISVEIQILKSSSHWRDGLSRSELIEKMPNLRALWEAKFSAGLTPESGEGAAWIQLASELKIFAWSQMNWVDKVMPLRRTGTLYEIASDLSDAVLDRVFTRPETRKSARTAVEGIVGAAQKELKSTSFVTKIPLAEAGTVRVDYRSGLESGPDRVDIRLLHGDASERVFNGKSVPSMERRESERLQRIRGYEEDQILARQGLINTCEKVFQGR